MSQRDHGLMEPVDPPTNPTVPVSPPARDSMEDADPSLTRKRPRLDSGSKETLAMPAGHTSVPNTTAHPREQQVEMTIRSQPPSSASSHPMDTTDDVEYASAPDAAAAAAAAAAGLGDDVDPDALIASTEIGSVDADDGSADSPPVIAIDDDDSDTMVGYTEPNAAQIEYESELYFQRFPFAAQGDYLQAVHNIAVHFRDAPLVDGTVLPQVSLWLNGLPHQSSRWKSYFVNKCAFWDSFAGMMGRILFRKLRFGDRFCDDDQNEEDIFTTFFAGYLRACALLLQADADTLLRWSSEDTTPDIPSCKHIRYLALIVRPDKPHVFGLLEREYGVDVHIMTLRLAQEFIRFDGIKSLFTFAHMAHGERTILLHNSAAVWMVQFIHYFGWSLNEATAQDLTLDRSMFYQDTLQFFYSYNADLQVTSKATDITHTKEMVTSMSALLHDLCRWDSSIAEQLADELLDFRDPESPVTPTSQDSQFTAGLDHYRQDPSVLPALVTNAWKFKLLRKYVVKGRMELRVMSIGTMDLALVAIWKEYHPLALGPAHPVMQYLAEFLLHERVTDYIISVDSHPQIISRSGNVVGFLVVTKRYTNAQTDAIWNTVSRSSDPRVVSATLSMLANIFGLMEVPELLYLFSKYHELPIENYTPDLLRAFRDLTIKMQAKNPDWSDYDSDIRPWNIVVRVLQDTSPGKNAGKLFYTMHNEAYDQLYNLRCSIMSDERHEICRKCATLIANRSPQATGSVRAITVLTTTYDCRDPLFFVENPEATRHILEELCAFVKEVDDITSTQAHALQYRLDLLCFLISYATEAIPSDLYQDIWDHLVGKYSQTSHLRDLAWSKILEATKHNHENDFCKQLISSYVPNLEPIYYTPGLFNFVAAYRFQTTRRVVATPEGEKELLQIRGADLLWSMVLSAPQNTIEDHAAALLAARYLELGMESDVSLEEVEAAHVALVEQCVQELSSAYKILRNDPVQHGSDQMDIAPSESVRQQNERRFTRTIMFLKGLLMAIRKKPDFNRGHRSDSKVEPLDLNLAYDDAIEITYQTGTERSSLLASRTDTLQEVIDRLCLATSCSKINLFARGQRINIAEKGHETFVNLGFADTVLLVQKIPGNDVIQPVSGPSKNCSVFETTLVNQFEKLFACMDGEDTISVVLYEFLLCFPFPERIAQSVEDGTSSVDDLFPPGHIFQAKYAAEVLKWKLKEQVRKNTLNDRFLGNAVRLLDAALLNPVLIKESLENTNEYNLACVLVHTLLDFLKERPSTETSATYFSNEALLVDRLLNILAVTLKAEDDHAASTWHCYASIVEASLHSRTVWEAFVRNSSVTVLHKALLLSDPRRWLREHIARIISSVCGGALPPSSAITETDTIPSFWAIVSSILSEAPHRATQSEQLLDIADQIFRRYDENHRNEESLRSYLTTWSGLLLDYDHIEFVGRDEVDFVVLGFTKLLLSCIASLKSLKKPLNYGSLVEKIWNKFLFVPRVVDMDEQALEPALPVLDSKTRRELYDLVLALSDDRTSFNKLLELAKDVAFDEGDMVARPISMDRTNEIRSSTGYLGLYNPRAICYMNSLLTQLFMNVNFRKFMLGLNIADRGGSPPERLLQETQKLFANLQNSYRKAADPRDFAACVEVAKDAPIDISVQMDADEFYNLLFDQWEKQMEEQKLSPETRQEFRSFYGGQTVNQIKSKECEHVSEREESFFVVQCDVQGKSNLTESLQAYVEGDVMEGDNKYKCESCGGKMVDAVKRTCLKEVPNNLMLHLKRFDYDLMEMRKFKINDLFEFPSSIDISPYKIEHLSDPSQPRQEDVFELVGVLVHQGTSENGHYYSYIRERPSPPGSMAQWLEFNDREVDSFDHQSIPPYSFGGYFEDSFPRQLKNFSAYMLFYQRKSAMQNDHNKYMDSPSSGIAKVPVPSHLDKAIREDNEGFIREYSLYDPCHAKFARQVLTNLRTINHGICSEDHQPESQAISFVLEYLCQMLFRTRNVDIFDEIFSQLRRTMLSCPVCCRAALRWLATQDYAMTNMLLQCLHMKVRSQMRALLIDSLLFLREKDPAEYGIEGIEVDGETAFITPVTGILVEISERLLSVAEETYLTTRGWDDLYLTLCQLSNMGAVETSVLLSHRFLEFCLRIFCMHAAPSLRTRDPDLWRVVEKKKRIYNRMIEFVYTLLSKMDSNLPIHDSRHINRLEKFESHGLKFALARDEKALLYLWHEENRALAALDRMLELFDHEKTEVFYPGEILQWMLQSKDPRFLHSIHTTVSEGISMLQPPSSDPYVRAALPYCEASHDASHVDHVIEAVAKSAHKLVGNDGGQAAIRFLEGLLHAENDDVMRERGVDFFFESCLLHSKKYATSLLLFNDDGVRKATSIFLHDLFTKYKDDAHVGENTLKLKYKAVRYLAGEMSAKIADEHEQNTTRSYVQPMITACAMFIQLLGQLQETEDPYLQQLMHPNDAGNLLAYHSELESLRHWALDADTPVSTGEGYEHSDYGKVPGSPTIKSSSHADAVAVWIENMRRKGMAVPEGF